MCLLSVWQTFAPAAHRTSGLLDNMQASAARSQHVLVSQGTPSESEHEHEPGSRCSCCCQITPHAFLGMYSPNVHSPCMLGRALTLSNAQQEVSTSRGPLQHLDQPRQGSTPSVRSHLSDGVPDGEFSRPLSSASNEQAGPFCCVAASSAQIWTC